MYRVFFLEAVECAGSVQIFLVTLFLTLIELVLKSFESRLVTGELVVQPPIDAADCAGGHSHALADFFVCFAGNEMSGDQDASSEHDPLTLGKEVAKKLLHGGPSLDGPGSSVERVEYFDAFQRFEIF